MIVKKHNISGVEGGAYAERPKSITVEYDDFTPGCTKADMHDEYPSLEDKAAEQTPVSKPNKLCLQHDGGKLIGAFAVFESAV